MKTKVIEFFQNLPEAKHEQFNKAFELYRQSEGKNIAVERVINATGYTPSGLDNLLYDLQKLHGISDVEKSPLAPEGGIKKVVLRQAQDDSEQIADLSTEPIVVSTEPSTEANAVSTEAHPFSTVMQTEKAFYPETQISEKYSAKSIRVEFPFLNEKDCPDEMKILMADKISAWNRYLATQEYLVKIEAGEVQESDEHKAELAKEAIEYFDENQKIYDELNCYQTTGKILGVHPIFKKLQLTREVEAMTADELIKYRGSSAKFASVKKTALAKAKKAKDEAKVREIEAAVAERSEKLFLVNKKLGV